MDRVQLEIRSAVTGTLDLVESDDFPLSLTRIGTDTADLSKRGGTFTTSFKVPATKSNNQLLDHIYHSSTKNTKDLDADLEAIIKVNEFEIERGFVRLDEITTTPNGREYSFKFFGENTDWTNELKDLYLKDLSFTYNTIKYDASTISNSWSNTVADEWVFALINRGARKAAKTTSVEDYLPELFLNPLIKKMFNAAGYSTSSSWLDSGATKKLILTFFGKLFNISEQTRNTNFVRAHISSGSFSNTTSLDVNNLADTDTTLWNAKDGGGNENWTEAPSPSTDSGNNLLNTTYTAPLNAFYKFAVNLQYVLGDFEEQGSPANTFLSSALLFDFYWLKNGTDEIPIQGLQNYKLDKNGTTIAFDTGFVNLQANDTMQLYYRMKWDTSPAYIGDIPKFQNSGIADAELIWAGGASNAPSEITVEIGDGIPKGATFTLTDVLDDNLPCLEIINDVSRMFNLRWRTDNFSKTVYFEPREDFITALTDAIDWSDKMDVSRDYTLRFNSSAYDRFLEFRFVDDDAWLRGWEADWGVDWAEYTHSFPSKFKDGVSQFGTKHLAATHYIRDVFATNTASTEAPYTARIWSKYGIVPPEFSNDHKPRILEYNYATQTQNARFIFEGTTYSTVPAATMSKLQIDNNPIFSTLNNVRWDTWEGQAGLVETYYSKTLRELEEGKKLTCYIKLDFTDWKNLDFRKPVYFDERFEDIHGYWLIEKVQDFKPLANTVTKVVLSEYQNYESVTVNDNSGGAGSSSASSEITGGGGGDTTFTAPGGGDYSSYPSWELNNGGDSTAEAGQGQFVTGFGNVATAFGQTYMGWYASTGSDLWAVGGGLNSSSRRTIFAVNSDGDPVLDGTVIGGNGSVVEISSNTTADNSVLTYLCDTSTSDLTLTFTEDDTLRIGKKWEVNKLYDPNTVTLEAVDGLGQQLEISGDSTGIEITTKGDTAVVKYVGDGKFILT